MATSGTLISSKYNSAYWSFEWTSTQTSAGKTTVSWNLYARGRSSSPTQYYTKIILYINDSEKYRLWDEVATFTGKKYASGSFTVTHNNAGTGSFTARVYVTKIYDALSNIKPTETVILDNNRPNTVNFTYPTVFTDEETINIGYENILTDKSDLISLEVGLKAADHSEIVPLQTITSNISGDIGSGTYSFDFQGYASIIHSLANTTNSLKVYLTLQETYNGYTYGVNKVVTINIINANPTQSPAVVDSNTTTSTLTGNTSKFILGYSIASATFNSTAKKSATISSQTITDGSGTILRSGDGIISPINTNSLIFKTIDSRGNSVSITKNLTTIAYFKPSCQVKGVMQTSKTAFTVSIIGSVFYGSFGAKNNSFTIQYRYRNDSTNGSYSSWINTGVSVGASSFTGSFNVTVDNSYQNYTFQVRIIDALSTVTSAEYVFTTGLEPVLKVKDSNNVIHTLGVIKGQTNGVSAYQLAKNAGFTGTEAEFATKLLNPVAFPIGAIYTTFSSTSPATSFGGTWTQLKDKFILTVGNTYALNATGGEATHLLTTTEMPNHKHQSPYQTYATSASAYLVRYRDRQVYDSYQYMTYTGGGTAHNNMPPYVVAKVWQRTG